MKQIFLKLYLCGFKIQVDFLLQWVYQVEELATFYSIYKVFILENKVSLVFQLSSIFDFEL